MNKKRSLIIIISFITPIIIFAFLYLILPAKQISTSEKRSLQQRPEFSFKTMLNGTYAEELDAYYTDQLPMREFFIGADQSVRSQLSTFFGLKQVQLVSRPGAGADLGLGENLGTDGKEIVTFPTTSKPSPSPEVTDPSEPTESSDTAGSEALATPTPAVSDPSVSSSANAYTGTSDDTDEIDSPVTTEPSTTPTITTAPTTSGTTAGEEEPISQTGGILVLSNRAVEVFYSNQSIIDSYVSLLDLVVSRSPNSRVFSLIAPTASEFYAPSDYRQGSSNQKDVIAKIYAAMGADVHTVDAYSKIAPHTEDYLYFRTDHHWTGLGAYYAYTALAEEAGFTPLGLSAMTHGQVAGDFLGTLYAWANQPANLSKNPDFVEYWMPPVTAEGYAFTDTSMSAGYAISLIKTEVGSSNKYLAFTEGDHGLARFETSVKNGRSIMVIKESYGNAMVPYLAAHYEYVYVFDPRKATMDFADFVSGNEIDDILIVNYSLAIGNQGWKDALRKSLN